jgi:hypothetical protein
MKPFTHALALGFYFRVPTEGSSKRLFYCLYVIRTPHDSSESAWTAWKKTQGLDYTPKITLLACQRGTRVDIGTWVGQANIG